MFFLALFAAPASAAGNHAVFSGDEDRINLGVGLDPSSRFTWEGWVSFEQGGSSSYDTIFDTPTRGSRVVKQGRSVVAQARAQRSGGPPAPAAAGRLVRCAYTYTRVPYTNTAVLSKLHTVFRMPSMTRIREF